jgi:cytoskeletal protein CcmA (bactofilin family)
MIRKSSALNGFLDGGARIEGTLTFQDVFRVDGSIKGTVLSDQELVVGESGSIEGEIRVGRLSVSGTVRGIVYAREKIEVHSGARVFAELHCPSLVVEEGAIIQGPVETGPVSASTAVGERPAPPRRG